MKTVVTDSPLDAAAFIRSGGIVAFPTETVYGLGADVFSEAAIYKVFGAKQRPADNPLIVHIADLDQVNLLAAEITNSSRKFVERFFPGPLTVVLKKSERVPLSVTAGLENVAIRMPLNEMALEFLAACKTPVAAPSANLSGRPSPTTWEAVSEDLDGRIDCILRGDPTEIGLESTVVDCTRDEPVILRPGAISLEELRSVISKTRKLTDADRAQALPSPGLLHRHYSPAANVVLINAVSLVPNAETSAYIGLSDRTETFRFVKMCETADDYARELFEFFRDCDRRGIGTVYCEKVAGEGIGAALMDRLERAAEG
jgi:L-threonylcarbamoyladenylate synthase